MSTDRELDRIVRSWMDEGVTQLPDRVLDLVLDQIPATPQRHASWLARRFPPMNNYARLGLVAAAVLAVVIVGIAFFGRPPDVGPPVGTESPAPSLQPSAAAADNPLVGTWLAPEVTCEQQVATIEAAGYTAAQIAQARNDLVQEVGPSAAEGIFAPTCTKGATNQYSLVFDGLPAAATMRSARVYDYDAVASPYVYRVVDDSTFELGGRNGAAWEYCLTFQFVIDGDQLTIQGIIPSCTGTGDAPLLDQIALTAFLETSSFTRQP